jgi:tetratricopeptide (TPR) repeat protein
VLQQATTDPVWLQRLRRWLEAIEWHRAGTDDAEARAIATWTRSDLRTLLADLLAVRDGLVRAWTDVAAVPDSRMIPYGGHEFRMPELQQLLRLSDDEARRGEMNRILWAGTLLHSDIALLVPSEDRPIVGRSLMVRFRDGLLDGYEYPVTAQWEVTRGLLDAIRPDPAGDDTVLRWYKATASYLLMTSLLSDAAAQLDRGRQLFPGDADLLFFSGCVHEAYTEPQLQDAARLAVLPPGRTINLGSPRSHLQDAEDYFRKALEKNARLTEARVRLGRILGVLGRHQEAAEQLRQAATTIGDSQVVYYAYMFLGDEEQALGRRDAARDCYERAATVYPRAQSPLFALSNLASRAGDMVEARRAADRIRQLPADDNERLDPWFGYYTAGGRNSGALLNNLKAAIPRGANR